MQMEHTLKIQKHTQDTFMQRNKKQKNKKKQKTKTANELIHKTKLLKLLHSTT